MRLSHPGVAFLDRDGTINVKALDGEYIERPEDLVLLPRAAAGIRMLNDAGVRVAVVTNQRGIALDRMTEADLAAVHERLKALLEEEAGAHVDTIVHCPHNEGECSCRKPGTGMLLRVRELWPWVMFEHSALIGDSRSDLEAGRALGIESIQIGVDTPDLATVVAQLVTP